HGASARRAASRGPMIAQATGNLFARVCQLGSSTSARTVLPGAGHGPAPPSGRRARRRGAASGRLRREGAERGRHTEVTRGLIDLVLQISDPDFIAYAAK
ncbi:hypothetical protein, partial [Streptomyces sp. ID05-04B]|uniref:hypothetical protein n=1 Tax=Streptomyces sp. ID05-04B TaxID=3028661 RepID=UPI0029CA9DB3